jgi:hypothetical protein
MKTTKLIAAAILACGMIFTSCKKEAGPKGDTGPAGNANVQNSTVTVHPADWVWDNTNSLWYFNSPLSCNANAAVMGYVQASAGKEFLPYHDNALNTRYEFATNLTATSPYIQLQSTNFNTVNAAPVTDKVFYFVIIPPQMKKPGVNYSSYAEVKAAHHIEY